MKKKPHKRMQMGGMAKMDDAAGRAMMKGLRGSRVASMPMKPMPSKGGTSMMQGLIGGRGVPATKGDMVGSMPVAPPSSKPTVAMPMTSSQTGSVAGVAPTTSRVIGGGSAPGGMMQRQVMRKGGKVQGKKMRGGGLARKGVGMALAKGGMVKANGCAKRGKTRGKMV
jgi:hypothetical protein